MNQDRIYFEGNPWPAGHKIEQFEFWGRLAPGEGVWFELDLRTENYYAESKGVSEEDSEADWTSTVVWRNYHRAHLHADGRGFVGATKSRGASLGSLAGTSYQVDATPKAWDDAAFHIYLLGHDSVAEHVISFERRNPDGTFVIDWTGSICLSYAGRTKYEHRFRANISAASFAGIKVPAKVSDSDAVAALAEFWSDPSELALSTVGDKRVFLPVR